MSLKWLNISNSQAIVKKTSVIFVETGFPGASYDSGHCLALSWLYNRKLELDTHTFKIVKQLIRIYLVMSRLE